MALKTSSSASRFDASAALDAVLEAVELEEHVRRRRARMSSCGKRRSRAGLAPCDARRPAPQAPRAASDELFGMRLFRGPGSCPREHARRAGLRSVPIASRPASIASTSTVPDPQNGSSTTPRAGENAADEARAVSGMHARAGYA